MSAKKPKRFVPNTPAKKNKSHASQEIYSPFANILHFSDETQEDSTHKQQQLNHGGSSYRKMKVTAVQLQKQNRFMTDFSVMAKLGEGSFGEAFKVRSKIDG